MKAGRHDITVRIDEPFAAAVGEEWLGGVARRVLDGEGVPAAELGIVVTDDDAVRALNRRYAGEDEPTDVLSFSLTEGEEFVGPPDAVLRLGEVVIAYPTAERQAAEHGRPTETEVAHLLAHGVLHLLGYDHAEPDEERLMRAKEEALLAALGH
ncbi:MAG: rRNA maturation RNase YbeY [Chloroflexi bacterium]|nr:rRNA maturation RNase YbeY [Chloroflexota bacterium]